MMTFRGILTGASSLLWWSTRTGSFNQCRNRQAGEVTFSVTNDGKVGHEFLVVKTEIAPGEIPLDGDHFAEPTDGIEVIDEIGEFAVGTTETLTLNLEAGKYPIVCNLPDHYKNGMHIAFEVVN